jgi:uncharacterized membrane protein YccF (DUF307 family)
MSLILNLLWVILGGGLVIGLEYLLGGLILCLTIVGIPFGLQCFKMAGFGFWPFGRDFVLEEDGLAGGVLRVVFNIIWFLVAGLWIFLSHLVLGVALALTIIGIPFALQHLKFGLLALAPFGRRVR